MIDIGLPPAEPEDAAPAAARPRLGPLTIIDAFVEAACERVREGKPLRRKLAPWGRVHVDRPLPFLVVYRRPVGRPDADTESLIVGEASYIIASGGRRARAGVTALVEAIAEVQAESLRRLSDRRAVVHARRLPCRLARPPGSLASASHGPARAGSPPRSASLENALGEVRIKGGFAEVEIGSVASVRPPGMPPLLTAGRAAELNVHVIGLEVQPVFRDPGLTESYPLVRRALHKGISRALKRAVFDFTRLRTSHRPPSYHALGRNSVVKAVWDVDRRLAEVSNAFDFILQVTPTNADEAWAELPSASLRGRPRVHVAPAQAGPDAGQAGAVQDPHRADRGPDPGAAVPRSADVARPQAHDARRSGPTGVPLRQPAAVRRGGPAPAQPGLRDPEPRAFAQPGRVAARRRRRQGLRRAGDERDGVLPQDHPDVAGVGRDPRRRRGCDGVARATCSSAPRPRCRRRAWRPCSRTRSARTSSPT